MHAADHEPSESPNICGTQTTPCRTAQEDPARHKEPGKVHALRRGKHTPTRDRRRSWSGHITYIHGAEGERLRGELTSVIHELLQWAITADDITNPSCSSSSDTCEDQKAA